MPQLPICSTDALAEFHLRHIQFVLNQLPEDQRGPVLTIEVVDLPYDGSRLIVRFDVLRVYQTTEYHQPIQWLGEVAELLRAKLLETNPQRFGVTLAYRLEGKKAPQ